jgi:hypothetical protein
VLTETEIRAIAQRVVNESKLSARVEDGTLKRSIKYTINRGVYEFRQMIYGQYGTNSQLEKNIRKYMPYGTKWELIYLEIDGKDGERTGIRKGRATKTSIVSQLTKSTTERIRNLIAATRKKKDGEAEK